MISRRPLLTLATTLVLATFAIGQETAAPPIAPRLRLPNPGGNLPNEAPSGGVENPLIPDDAPAPGQSESEPTEAEKKEKLSKTEAFAQDVLEKIRFRQVQTKALADPAIQAEWNRSVTAKTDLEKRAALKQYYKLLYARMAKIDGSLKTQIELKATEADRRLTQTHISPTEARDAAERSTSARVFVE